MRENTALERGLPLENCSWTEVQTPRSVESGLHDIFSDPAALGDGPRDIVSVIPCHDVHLLPRIHTALDVFSLPVPSFDEIEVASSSRSKKVSHFLSKQWTQRRKTYTIRTQSNAAKELSDNMPVIDVKFDRRLVSVVLRKC